MEKYVFALLCALSVFMIAMAVIGWWKNKPVAKFAPLGAYGGTFAGLACILYTIPWK